MEPPALDDADPALDRGPEIIRLIWALTSVAFTTSLLRIYARLRHRMFGWDDTLMLCAMLCFVGWSIVLTLYANQGGLRPGQHVKTGPDKVHVATVRLLNWLSQPLGMVGVACGRICVAALLLGIMVGWTELRWHRLFLRTVPIALAALVAGSCSILTLAQCSPANALWDTSVAGRCIDAHVMRSLGAFTGAFDTVADASLAAFPAALFCQLNCTSMEKMQLTIVFGLNILACVCSGVKTHHLVQLVDRGDQTWATYDIFVWLTGELFLMIVCGAVPALHLLLFPCSRSAAASMTSRIKSNSSRKSTCNAAPSVFATELGDMTHMTVRTRTTVKRGALTRSESKDYLVEDHCLPQNGVRVDVVYHVRRDTRPNSESSTRSLASAGTEVKVAGLP